MMFSVKTRKAVTLIEVCLAVLFLSLLFGSANAVMTYSRRETEKGFWIQQSITQLRNGTRAITDLLKKTSYPSTIIKKASGDEKIVSFKEQRTYDISGRLRDLKINPSENFDMHSIVTGSGGIAPSFVDQPLMTFPVCQPEKDLETGFEAGKINWVQLILKPSDDYNISGLGTLWIIEREETYDTRGNPLRAFSLSKSFDDSIAVSRKRAIITDVSEVQIDSYDIKELRGVFVTKDGAIDDRYLKRTLVSIAISCCHPKDRRIWLSDQCSIINNVEVVEMAGTSVLKLVKINSAGPGGSARIKLDANTMDVNVGGAIGNYTVKTINPDSVVLVQNGTELERMLFLNED